MNGGRARPLRYCDPMKLSGRFVRVFHWIAPVLLPFLVIFGRGILGAPMGWMALIALLSSPLVIIAMYALPIVVVFDRDARAARSTRRGYNVASWVLWGGMLGMMLTLEDGGDAPPFGSVLSTWGLDRDLVNNVLLPVAMLVAMIGWIAALIYAIAGVVASRTAPGGAGPVHPPVVPVSDR